MTETETETETPSIREIIPAIPPEYGTFSNRMLATIIDLGIIFMIILPLIDMIMSHAFAPVDMGRFEEILNSPELRNNPPQFINAIIQVMPVKRLLVENLLEVFFLGLYILPFWFRFSATPGKMLLRLEIQDAATGNPMTRKQAVIRFLGYIVSALPLSLGFVWVLLNRKARGFHDLIAGTVVVVTPKSENE